MPSLPTHHQIAASDGLALAARIFQPDTAPAGVVVINAGTCLPQAFYEPVARFLSTQSLVAITYDYRGVGESRPASLRGFDASIHDWAAKDMKGVIDWATTKWPNMPVNLLAHSMGGQIIGLCESITKVSKIATVASSYGNPHFYEATFKKRTQRALPLLPLVLGVMGYVPAKLIGGEDWPKGVAQQWRAWGQQSDKSFSELVTQAGWDHRFGDIVQPFRAYFIGDDDIATEKTIPFYQRDFARSDLTVSVIRPEPGQRIGHFGFFTGRVPRATLLDLANWLS